jgi:hypothetical protein
MAPQDRRRTFRPLGRPTSYGLLLFAIALCAGALVLRPQATQSWGAGASIEPSAAVPTPIPSLQPAFAFNEACATQSFPPRQCDAIIDDAMDSAGLAQADVAAVEFLPFDRVQTLSGGQVALVRLHLVVGTTVDEAVSCVGVSFRPACNEAAEIMVHDGVSSDVPCWGEPPDGCATPAPTPDGPAIDQATPFERAAIGLLLDRKGHYEVRIGGATLPDGYLQERSFRIGNAQPTTFWINGGVFLDVRSDVPGRPWIGDIYREPFDGPEPVSLYLVFDVDHLEGPSVLQIRNVVVR